MNDQIGVIGQYGPQRSKMDEALQKKFGHPQDPTVPNYMGSPVGVIGQYGPERSTMDNIMQQEFGKPGRENYTYDTNYRSVKDKMMQVMFNPYYKGK